MRITWTPLRIEIKKYFLSFRLFMENCLTKLFTQWITRINNEIACARYLNTLP